jgi:hypothetical protein
VERENMIPIGRLSIRLPAHAAPKAAAPPDSLARFFIQRAIALAP